MTVYPKRGFLNTEFKLRSNEKDNFTIVYQGKTVSNGIIMPGETVILPKFSLSGQYSIISTRTQERQEISVEDALRLGSSELKKSYIFDNFPYLIFVMKDRIHIYDPIIGTYVYSENYLSPNDIRAINESELLFVTEHESGTTISVFDIEKLSIVASKEINCLVSQSIDGYRLFSISEDNKYFNIINAETLDTIESFELENSTGSKKYMVNEETGLLIVFGKESIFSFDLNSDAKKALVKRDSIGITENGFLITCKGSYYTYQDLNPLSKTEGQFSFDTDCRRSFKGFELKNEEWSNNGILFIGDIEATLSDFKKECDKKIESGDKSKEFTKNINKIDNSLAILEFFPTESGVYIVENKSIDRLHSMSYHVRSNYSYVSGRDRDRKFLLHWISKGYEIRYKSGIAHQFEFSDSTCINKDIAAFALNKSEYIVLRNGIIIETYITSGEAKGRVMPRETKEEISDEKIIINGKEVYSYSIVCKSSKKLVRRNDGKYGYCIRLQNGSWEESKSFVLEEQKHKHAKMSPDGKYLVYSKGRNQYALYNIANQTEETVLTGNFVDFDKSGNLLFMKDEDGNAARFRELRIYDPITYSWEKTFPEYYQFVSPDGKLYSKTALKEKYYDLVNNIEISKEQFDDIQNKYGINSSRKVSEVVSARKRMVEANRKYFETYAQQHSCPEGWIEKIHNTNYAFEIIISRVKQFAVIGIVGTNKEIELEIGQPLSYLNYVAFSYDNKYVGIVGKPSSYGYLKLSQIEFDEKNNVLKLKKDICDMAIAKKATWTCAFTRQGMFGTYDSEPNLYLIDRANFEEFTGEKKNDFGFLRDHFSIENRSLLCFSPTGKFMALSNQGYEPKSLGGRGHVPSNEVFIYSTDSKEMLANWNDHGGSIASKNVVNAGFSIDETKLMTVSGDGVIVVRNINNVVQNNQNTVPSLSKVS